MSKLLLQGLLAFAVVVGALTSSVIAGKKPNIIEPMCKEGKVSILQKSTKTLRSYNGELCKIPVIAKWVQNNCKDTDELYKSSSCKINAKYALQSLTPRQNQFPSDKIKIEDPQDVSDLMEVAKRKGALSPNDMNIWQKYKLFFPKPSSKPSLHFK